MSDINTALSSKLHSAFDTEQVRELKLAHLDFAFWFLLEYYTRVDIRRNSIAVSNALQDLVPMFYLSPQRMQILLNGYATPDWLSAYRKSIDLDDITDSRQRDLYLTHHRNQITRLYAKLER